MRSRLQKVHHQYNSTPPHRTRLSAALNIFQPSLILFNATETKHEFTHPVCLPHCDLTLTVLNHLYATALPTPHLPKSTMANYLASIFGTEADKVNCSFYYKIGACRHGDRCSRKHVKPSYSQTILLPNLYQNPAYDPKVKMNASQLQNHFDAFYEDFWCEMCKFGEIEEVVVCDNNNDRESFPNHS